MPLFLFQLEYLTESPLSQPDPVGEERRQNHGQRREQVQIVVGGVDGHNDADKHTLPQKGDRFHKGADRADPFDFGQSVEEKRHCNNHAEYNIRQRGGNTDLQTGQRTVLFPSRIRPDSAFRTLFPHNGVIQKEEKNNGENTRDEKQRSVRGRDSKLQSDSQKSGAELVCRHTGDRSGMFTENIQHTDVRAGAILSCSSLDVSDYIVYKKTRYYKRVGRKFTIYP